jgi:hypothetical protein
MQGLLNTLKLSALLVLLMPMLSPAQNLEDISKQKPFEIHGSVSAGVGYYKTSQTFGNTRRPYAYFINAAPVISLYGIQIPINFTFNEGGSQVRNPFAQFGINPYWKWIKLYGGWTNMNWSPTTLGGKTFIGAGIEINPSLFRFGAMYGMLNPVIAGRSDTLSPFVAPQYKRTGYAFKLGMGNEKNFFDLIFLKGKDHANSVQVSDKLNFSAQENAVFGIHSFQSFLKQKLTWQLDGAVSAITRNIASEALDIGESGAAKFLQKIIVPRLSTSYAWTAHTAIHYRAEKFSLGLDYLRIQPEYVSMGVDFILNDQQRFSAYQNFHLAKNKVLLSFQQLYQHDNLNKRKAAKTNRTNVGVNANYQHNQNFGISLGFNNFVVFKQSGSKPVNDTLRLGQIQNMLLITPRYNFFNEKHVHSVQLSLMYQRIDDLNRFTRQFTQNNTINVNTGYTLSLPSINLSIGPSINLLYSVAKTFSILNIHPSLNVGYVFWKGRLSANAMIGYTAGKQNTDWNTQTINNDLSLSYRINNMHSLRTGNSLMYSRSNNFATSEYRGELVYTLSF